MPEFSGIRLGVELAVDDDEAVGFHTGVLRFRRRRGPARRAARVRGAERLVKTGAPFTVENVCDLAGVGKTFIYDKRRRELTRAILTARDASQAALTAQAEQRLDNEAASWRERALNAEALAKSLRTTVKERDARISDLTGQLYDPDGNHLAEQNAELRQLVLTLNQNLRNAEIEHGKLRRSLDAARANIKHERERSVTLIGSIRP